MKKTIVLPVFSALLVLAGAVWLFSDPTGEIAGQLGAIDEEQAALDRTRERTELENRSGVEVPPVEPAPVNDSGAWAASPPSAGPPEAGASSDRLQEGYSLGTYRGPMRRAPRTSNFDPEPSPNPEWLGSAAALDAILDQAASFGRPYSFAALRVSPGTDLQALNRSLGDLGSQVEGRTGEYVRVRVPAERGRLEAIAGLPGVLGIGAIPPSIKAQEAFVQESLSRSPAELMPVYITLMGPDPSGEWSQALSELGVVVGAYDGALRSYTSNLPAAALAQVVAADFVLSVEPVPVVTKNHESAVPVMGVDVFCGNGYFVVRRNPDTGALEVTDFAESGKSDRFGHTLEFFGGGQQMAQGSDGAHLYGTSSIADGHFIDAIHVFERASAMEPD